MADVFTKQKRSQIMSRIPSKNTGIELAVFRFLRKEKIYFKKHYAKVAGKPDVALPAKKIAVFIDGDFWHGYRYDQWKNCTPKKYWRDKIEGNIERDRRNIRQLRRKGWRVLRVWGHEITKKPKVTFHKVRNFVLQ